MPDSSEPAGTAESPYRQGRSLAALIPPDRRKQVAVLLVALGAVVGAAAFMFVDQLRQMQVLPTTWGPGNPPSTVPPPPDVTLPHVTLRGPDDALDLPQATPVIVNAWVQARPDSMDAFRASRDLAAGGGLHLPVPVVNVAFGKADPAWAAAWGVRERLVFDPDGSLVFTPLGVGSFTTYVIDAAGKVRYTDRPERTGYAQRMERVIAELTRAPAAAR
jgi:hypothetical protein